MSASLGAGCREARALRVESLGRLVITETLEREAATWLTMGLRASRAPAEIGRKRFGRIAIANADAGAAAYTDVAMDEAWRAVQELMDT